MIEVNRVLVVWLNILPKALLGLLRDDFQVLADAPDCSCSFPGSQVRCFPEKSGIPTNIEQHEVNLIRTIES